MLFLRYLSDLWKDKQRELHEKYEGNTFHEKVPEDWIRRMFDVMRAPHLHGFWFQLLTKRTKRLRKLGPSLTWAPNIWPGVTVERADYLFRVDDLINCGAPKCWLSIEPLLGPLDALELDDRIGWVIVGGESANGGDMSRRTKEEWVLDLRDRCVDAGVPFFHKQWGSIRYNPLTEQGKRDMTAYGPRHAKGGCLLQGKIARDVPAEYRDLFPHLTFE